MVTAMWQTAQPDHCVIKSLLSPDCLGLFKFCESEFSEKTLDTVI